MTVFQCMSCPKIKAGQPWKSSATKPMLCDACKIKVLSSRVPPVSQGVLKLPTKVKVRK